MRGRIGVVGGSIAGCAAALAAVRARCEVTVFERARTLRDRGLGVGMPADTHRELTAAGYVDAGMPVHQVSHRLWVVADPGEPAGRVLWRQPTVAVTTNWGLLWRGLAVSVPPRAYHADRRVVAVDPDGGLTTEDGQQHEFDVVVGADGHQSLVRSVVNPDAGPRDAGYGLWRGILDERALPAGVAGMLESSIVTVVFPGGHAIFYLIPSGTGDRLLNWGVYGRHDPLGQVARILPPEWAEVCWRTDSPTVYPVADMAAPAYVARPFLLAGDAATLTRPHAASGAVKALLDARCLQQVLEAGDSWDHVLAAYDAQRRPAGNELVEVSRRIGRAQVEDTPVWESMTPGDMAEWAAATLAGHRHYLYQHSSEQAGP